MPTQRKEYSKEFKQKAVRLVLEEKQSTQDVARSLGIPSVNLNRWIRKWRDQHENAFPGHGKQALSEEQRLIEELKAQVKQLQMDNAILKKAAAFFAKETL